MSVLNGVTTEWVGSPRPKDPLSPAEVETACRAVTSTFPPGTDISFHDCELDERMAPAGTERPRWWDPSTVDPPTRRRARVVAIERATGLTLVATVAVDAPSDFSGADLRYVSNVQPALDGNEYDQAEQLVKSDPRFALAMSRRGVTEIDQNVMVDLWCVGYFGPEDAPTRRLALPLVYLLSRTAGDSISESAGRTNGYARPVEGLHVRIDLLKMEIIEFEDQELVPIPPPDPLRVYESEPIGGDSGKCCGIDSQCGAESVGSGPSAEDGLRPLRPLAVVQPEGASFKVDGYEVAWDRWRFSVGFNPREGLVLHDIAVFDPDRGGLWRPVAERLSFAEMVVPYGDPRDPHFRKNAFDAGEEGLGKNAHSLVLGCDCLGTIHYFDAHFSNAKGGVETIKRAVCLHEEDAGLLWKHVDWRSGHTGSARARRLSVSFLATVANYEYGFYFHFGQDGTIETEVKLTGIVSTGVALPGRPVEPERWGTKLTKTGLYAPNHQHFFICRLHMAVDGPRQKLAEVAAVSDAAHPANKFGGAFKTEVRPLPTTSDAQRDCNPAESRHWVVQSATATNRVGGPTGWRLVPGANVPVLAEPDSALLRRASFLQHQLWATPYHPEQRFPGGDFPNQSPDRGAGLEQWCSGPTSLDGESIVLWYVFGVTHLPRPEDWPVMPVEHTGFVLQPAGFFDRSPAIRVTPAKL